MKITTSEYAAMTETELYDLINGAQDELRRRTESNAAEVVIEALKGHDGTRRIYGEIAAMTFGAQSYDDGYYFVASNAKAFFADGTAVDLDLSDSPYLGDLLTELTAQARHENGFVDLDHSVRIELPSGNVDLS